MAYSRWNDTDWYIFWQGSTAKNKNQEQLAIWHVLSEEQACYKYSIVKDMLRNWNLSAPQEKIPGYREEDSSFLRHKLSLFVEAVDRHYASKHKGL